MVNGWVERSILEVLKPNGIKIGPFGSQLKKEMLLSDGVYRVYGQENVYEKDFSLGERFLTKDHFNHLISCEIVPGDFVMSTMGTIGKCAIVPDGIQRGIMDSHLIRLKFDEKKVRPNYILQLFSDEYHYLSDQTARLAVGGIMDGLSVGIVSRLNVVYPESLEEQEKVVVALSDLDDLINDLKTRIRKKKNIRQGTMQSLMTGKKRIPGFTKMWKEVVFSDVCNINAPMVNPQESQFSLLPHIGNESIEKHTGRLLSYNKVIDDNLVSGKYYFTETDVLYGNGYRVFLDRSRGKHINDCIISVGFSKKEFDELYLRNADGEAVVRRISKSVPSDFTVEPIHNKPIYDSGILNVFYVK